MLPSELGIDVTKYKDLGQGDVVGTQGFKSDEDGVEIHLFKGLVEYSLFYPPSNEEQLRCQTRSDWKAMREFVVVDGPSSLAQIWLRVQPKTKVPLRLPSYLATQNETHPLYAIIESASPSAYEIQIAFTRDCYRGNACHYGVLSGRRTRKKEGQPQGRRISFANGLTGYFVESRCGASCSDSTLTWDENGHRYKVGLKAEKLDTLKKVAESTVAKKEIF